MVADDAKKLAAAAAVDGHKAELTQLSDRVWRSAETALKEFESSKVIADYAEKNGLKVERGIAGLPTAFVASYGSGSPVIGILGEFDALPGISQKAVPEKVALEAGAAGHGCGHNLLGTAGIGAAVAIKELIAAGKLKGTIRYFGTPAEEAIGGKIYMIREGAFRGVDVMMTWHPDTRTMVDTEGYQANVQFFVDFHGKAAHAAVDPWNGRSALHAAEFFAHGVNGLRENSRPTVRMHYVMQNAGNVPNVIPEYTRVWMWIRDSRREGVTATYERVKEIAQGAALMAGVSYELIPQTGNSELNFNEPGMKLLQANLNWLGPIDYTPAEIAFAKTLQKSAGVAEAGLTPEIRPLRAPLPDPPGGSSDVGDVSWIVPTLEFFATVAPKGVPWHAWPVVASAGMSIGHKGMLMAAKTMATSAVDLFEDAAQRSAIQEAFRQSTAGKAFRTYIPDGPPPLPKRN
jgi:aminobenzoyl-glutamate utilization protein B